MHKPGWRIDCLKIWPSSRAVSLKHVKTVLLVDDDLGFAFWLGQVLDRTGYEAWPSRSVQAAESLLAEVRLRVDLLVVNASLHQAYAFAIRLRSTSASLKVIAVYEASDTAVKPFSDAGAVIRRKPQTIDASARFEWVHIVADVLAAQVGAR